MRRLAPAGVPTVVVARRRRRLSDLAAELAAAEGGRGAGRRPGDVAGCGRVDDRLTDPDRPIDLLVNNAGFGTSGAVVEIEPARMRDEIGVNVMALTALTHAALPSMIAAAAGLDPQREQRGQLPARPRLAVYAATKAYVTSFTEALHEELRGTGVHATVLCPGLTRTEFIQVSRGEEVATAYPGAAWMSAEAVATEGLRDTARGRALSVPGMQYKALVTTAGFIPRGMMRWMSGIAASRLR